MATSCVSICTVNIHGLRNPVKRKTFLRDLRKKTYDIICVQESYISDKDKDLWEKEWGGVLICSAVSNHSMGQLILVREKTVHMRLEVF